MKTVLSQFALYLLFFFTLPSCVNYYYVVRHAEKGPQANPDTQTQLSGPGLQRADALRDTLLSKNISIIFTSEYLRTQLTAKPTAVALGIAPTPYSTGDGVPALVAKLKAIPEKNVLVVGHSDTVPALVFALTGEHVTVPPGANLEDFDNLFVIKRNRCPNPDKYTLYKRTYGQPSN